MAKGWNASCNAGCCHVTAGNQVGTMIIKLVMLILLVGSIGLSAHIISASTGIPREDDAQPS
jgi:hypothetical protein